MLKPRFHSFKTVLLSGLLLAGTVASTPALAQSEDKYAGMDKDEAGLWYVMDKFEQDVKTSGARIKDPALNEYVTNLTCEIVGPDCEKLRIYILNAPEFNAAMAPNGMMIVNSGLLLRAENEAQLGCVIGHEYGHFIEGHTLAQWRAVKDVGIANLLIPIAGAIVGMASLSDFSRDQEREADKIGFEKISDTGYVPSECSDVWTNLIGETAESSLKHVRKRSKKTKNGIFSSHPVPLERAETLQQLADAIEGGDKTGQEKYESHTRQFLATWLKSELLAKDYDRHIYLFEQLKERGRHSATMNFYLGESYRLRREEGDKEKALSYWLEAANEPDAPALTWRSLAEHYRKAGEKDTAKDYYAKYLVSAPDAADKRLIEKYIERLSKEN